MTRRCSHCGHNGHNSRTCPDRGVRIFGVRLSDSSRMRKSVSTGNLSSYSGAPSQTTHHTPDHSENGNLSHEGYTSDGQNLTASKERKKGVPWTEEEHRLFLLGLQKLGKGDWRGISRNFVLTRTPTQVASHAQKYFIRQNNLNKRKRRSSLFDIGTDGAVGGMNRSMSTPSLATMGDDPQSHPSPKPSGLGSTYSPSYHRYNADGSSPYPSNPVSNSLSSFPSSSDMQKTLPYPYNLPHVGSSSSLESLGEKYQGDYPGVSRLSAVTGLSGSSGSLANRLSGLDFSSPSALGFNWSQDGMIRVPSNQSFKLDEGRDGVMLHSDYSARRPDDSWNMNGGRQLVTRRFLSDAPVTDREDGQTLPALKEEENAEAVDRAGTADRQAPNGEATTTGRDAVEAIISHLVGGKKPSTSAQLADLTAAMEASAAISTSLHQQSAHYPWSSYSHQYPHGFPQYNAASFLPHYGSLPSYPWHPYASPASGYTQYGASLPSNGQSGPDPPASPKLYRPTATLPAFVARPDDKLTVFAAAQEAGKEFIDESKGSQTGDSTAPGASRPSPLTLQLLESPSLRQSAFQSRTAGTSSTPAAAGNTSPKSSDVGHSPISVV